MPYLLEGTDFALGYEPRGYRGFKPIEEKIEEKFRRSAGRGKEGKKENYYNKRRGQEKTPVKRSYYHEVKKVPYVIYSFRRRGR